MFSSMLRRLRNSPDIMSMRKGYKDETFYGNSFNLTFSILALTLIFSFSTFSQTTTNLSVSDGTKIPTMENVQARLKLIEGNASLPPEQKSKVADLLNQTIEFLRVAAESESKTIEMESTRQQAPEQIKQIQIQLLRPLEEPTAPDLPLESLVEELSKQETALKEAKANLTALQSRIETRPELRKQTGELLDAAQKQKASLNGQILPQPIEAEPTELTEARQILVWAKQYKLTRETEAYDKEIQTYDIRGRLLTAKFDLATREVTSEEKVVNVLRAVVNELRQKEAAMAVQEAVHQERIAALESVGAGEALRQEVDILASEVADLTKKRVSTLQVTEKVARELRNAEETLKKTTDGLESLTKRVEAVGLNTAIGLLLRKQRASLPDLNEYHRAIRLREDIIAQTQVSEIEVTEARVALADINVTVEALLNTKREGIEDSEKETVVKLLRRMLMSKQSALDGLRNAYEDHLEKLFALDLQQRQLIEAAVKLRTFIDKRVLWIRSGSPLKVQTVLTTIDSLGTIGHPKNLLDIHSSFTSDIMRYPIIYAAVAAVILLLLGVRRRARNHLEKAGELARKRNCTSFRCTIESLAYTVLMAAWLPILLWFLGWRLSSSLESGKFAISVGYGLRAVALLAIAATTVRNFLRPVGLAEAHFGWPAISLKAVRRLVTVTALVAAVLLLLLKTTESLGDETLMESFGRVVFLLLMCCLSVFAYALLKSSNGPVWQILAKRNMERKHARGLWCLLVVALPVCLALLASAGYTYTAVQLLKRLYLSLAVGLLVGLLVGLIQRWMLIARRALAMRRARERREQAKAAKEGETQPTAPLENESDYLDVIDTQTHRLVRVFAILAFVLILWGVWAEVLPALEMLNEWTLWDRYEKLLSEEGVEILQKRPVTVAHLMLAAVIGVLTAVASSNIPGLLELVVLQRLNVGGGERYAIAAIVRYAIGAIGIILFFGALGIGWANVQWIVAALGLGLGFGLQEIFANFVSGLIILFERPLRVGDVVTVGTVSGTVSRIRMRATTITDWDRKELIVPNKEFVTGQLVNWTLSDVVIRIIIPVGIAYGSDTKLAVKILEEIAEKDTSVLHDPEPCVIFWGFGDSALNFELRTFVKTYTTYIETRHNLHMEIDKAFRKAGITIAFPQRDIHVHSIADVLPVIDNEERDK